MTNNIPEEVQHNVNDGGSSGYSSMNHFMKEDSAKEQAWVDRENDSVFSLAINNWFGLKNYILSFFPEKKS
jgi:hypothetical protein